MEEFPEAHREPQNPPENPFFFERKERSSAEVENYVEKRSLEPVAKPRHEEETYEDYKDRMGRALSYARKSLPQAAESLRTFHQEKQEQQADRRKRVSAENLLPTVKLQNRIVSMLADLDPEDRFQYIRESRVELNKVLEDAQVDKDTRSEMKTFFDGCEAVCGYMDKRKEELGEKASFFTSVFLDWKYGIDLVEFDARDDEKLDMRLVQNKSSFRSYEDIAKDQERHAAWIENELMGMHDILDNFSEVVKAEYGSERHEELRERLADSFADSALTALDIIEAGSKDAAEDALKNESRLSRLAFALSFQGDDENEDLARAAANVAAEDVDNLISRMPVARIYSAFAVNDETPVPPALLYSASRGERDVAVGTEPDL